MRVTIKKIARIGGSFTYRYPCCQETKSASAMRPRNQAKAMKGVNYHLISMHVVLLAVTQVIGVVLPDDSRAFYQNPFFSISWGLLR